MHEIVPKLVAMQLRVVNRVDPRRLGCCVPVAMAGLGVYMKIGEPKRVDPRGEWGDMIHTLQRHKLDVFNETRLSRGDEGRARFTDRFVSGYQALEQYIHTARAMSDAQVLTAPGSMRRPVPANDVLAGIIVHIQGGDYASHAVAIPVHRGLEVRLGLGEDGRRSHVITIDSSNPRLVAKTDLKRLWEYLHTREYQVVPPRGSGPLRYTAHIAMVKRL